jgi:RNA polymerase sigma-70 factor (ECF subfamily)
MRSGVSTVQLLMLARAGDPQAIDSLFARFLNPLQRWTSGRLPRWARDVADTTDIVQDALLHTLKQLPTFEVREEGGLQAYLRQAVLNRIRDEVRKRQRRGMPSPLDSAAPAPDPSPLELTIRKDDFQRYDAALNRLREEDREMLIGRLELGLSYEELAVATSKPSADAARKAAQRALVKLVEAMHRGR